MFLLHHVAIVIAEDFKYACKIYLRQEEVQLVLRTTLVTLLLQRMK